MNLLNSVKTVAELKQEALENTIKPFNKAIEAQTKRSEEAILKANKLETEIKEKQKAKDAQEALKANATSEISEARSFIAKTQEFFK